MSKAEILAELEKTGQDKVFRRTNNWEKAFDLHNKTTGRHKNMGCGSCYREVLAWLRG